MPELLTSQQIGYDIKYIDAIVEQLIEAESSLGHLVNNYSGRKPRAETAVGQQLTKALVAVQAGRSRLAKAVEEIGEIVPAPSLWDESKTAEPSVQNA